MQKHVPVRNQKLAVPTFVNAVIAKMNIMLKMRATMVFHLMKKTNDCYYCIFNKVE